MAAEIFSALKGTSPSLFTRLVSLFSSVVLWATFLQVGVKEQLRPSENALRLAEWAGAAVISGWLVSVGEWFETRVWPDETLGLIFFLMLVSLIAALFLAIRRFEGEEWIIILVLLMGVRAELGVPATRFALYAYGFLIVFAALMYGVERILGLHDVGAFKSYYYGAMLVCLWPLLVALIPVLVLVELMTSRRVKEVGDA